MKDLYTFDATPQEAERTYDKARKAYKNFFDELGIPYLVAIAHSGAIGGIHSHEYHFPTMNGEDTIVSCEKCSYSVNEEMTDTPGLRDVETSRADWTRYESWFGISKDRCHLVEALLPQSKRPRKIHSSQQKPPEINSYMMKKLFPELDLGIEDPLSTFAEYWTKERSATTRQATEAPSIPHLTRVYDFRISNASVNIGSSGNKGKPLMQKVSDIIGRNISTNPLPLNLARFQDGDQCPGCENNSIKLHRSVELGHTFYLGDRYSKPMNATFTTPPIPRATDETDTQQIQAQSAPTEANKAWFQMGCHGIGISRMIAAAADSLANNSNNNKQRLIWPRVMAPFEAAILATEENKSAAEEVWDLLARPTEGWNPLDAVLDDRDDKGLGWKLKDADLIGFPIVVILGSQFSQQGLCEVSIPRLGTRDKVEMDGLRDYIGTRLDRI
ncbi:MAG: hypothetical protein Q9178_004125 [Gyalolechia marmorata]